MRVLTWHHESSAQGGDPRPRLASWPSRFTITATPDGFGFLLHDDHVETTHPLTFATEAEAMKCACALHQHQPPRRGQRVEWLFLPASRFYQSPRWVDVLAARFTIHEWRRARSRGSEPNPFCLNDQTMASGDQGISYYPTLSDAMAAADTFLVKFPTPE